MLFYRLLASAIQNIGRGFDRLQTRNTSVFWALERFSYKMLDAFKDKDHIPVNFGAVPGLRKL